MQHPAVPAMERSPRLTLRGISKRFGKFQALRDVSLDVEPGEFVCLLGPSGSGKSTLLRIVAGFETPESGTLLADGNDITRTTPSERGCGMVFQSYALFPNLSVADNVGFGLVNRGLPSAVVRQRVSELLEMVGLTDHGRKLPSQISGGEQQRVALARALAPAPSLLLLDEPLSALDARVRLRLRDELKALQRRLGVTTVMVTHDQSEALHLADRLVVLHEGEVQQVGSPAQVYAKPRTLFVADFVGAMNLLPCRADGESHVRIGGLRLALADHPSCDACQEVILGIRPEAIRFVPSLDGQENAFRARIDGEAFHGGFVRLLLVPEAAPDLTLAADWNTGQGGTVPRLGQDVTVVAPPESLRVFPR